MMTKVKMKGSSVMSNLPKDPVMLLSAVNMLLRDTFSSVEELARANDMETKDITDKLASIGYKYDESQNQFK